MPIMGGIEFLEAVRTKDSVTPVIITTGFPEVETAIKAIQHGAYDYLIKPFQLELLAQKLQQALRTSQLLKENAVLSELASLHEITIKLTNTHDLEEPAARNLQLLPRCIARRKRVDPARRYDRPATGRGMRQGHRIDVRPFLPRR